MFVSVVAKGSYEL